jgi:cyclic pyranopterin phosphate synthase
VNDGELDAFVEWTRARPIAVRFIELMRCGGDAAFFERHHLAAARVEEELARRGWAPRARGPLDGPARELGHPEHAGTIGVIAPYAKDFCASCNRVRVTSRGSLRLCLFGEREDVPLRHLLGRDDGVGELAAAIAAAAAGTPARHHLEEGRHGQARGLASIGG